MNVIDKNEVSISLSGDGFTNLITGWTEVRITRGIERMPSDFELTMTDPYDGTDQIAVAAGMPCTVSIGEDKVVTGYIDRVITSIGPEEHTIKVIGRGKCQDLVDCAAVWKGFQFQCYNTFQIAEALAKPFGIGVLLSEGVSFAIWQFIKQVAITPGETAFSVIATACRIQSLLCYEDEHGLLILGRAGSRGAASGLAQGTNIESAAMNISMDKRFSKYSVMQNGLAAFQDMGGQPLAVYEVNDPLVNRYRPKFIDVEYGDANSQVAIARAQWEMNRRVGMGFQLNVTVDSWRDSDGDVWLPNTLVPFDIPALKSGLQTWLISEVTYSLGKEGKRCDMVIMPKEAFDVEPILYQPVPQDVAAALR